VIAGNKSKASALLFSRYTGPLGEAVPVSTTPTWALLSWWVRNGRWCAGW